MLMPQLQTKTPMRGGSSLTSLWAGSSLVRVSVQRTLLRSAPAPAAAPDASMTDCGMSFGPWSVPQT